jgi:hypothetical protein
LFVVVATDRWRGIPERSRHGSGLRYPWFLTASMADTNEGGSQEPAARPPRPQAASRPQLNRARTASSAARTTSPAPTPIPTSGGGTPSSSAGTTQAQPTATAAGASETGGMPYVLVDEGEDEDVPVAKKRKVKSDVWLEFDQVIVAGKQKAQCHWCKKNLVADGKAGTTHLRNHLKCCASRQVRKGLQQSTLKIGENKQGSVVVEKYVFDQQVARKELALMICVHEYPLSIVDHIGFRRFCAALQPLFKAVSRNTIKKNILDMYEVQRKSLVYYFQQCPSRIAVTTDMWTANHQKKGYMSVTVHFIDDDWKLKSFLLR